MGMLTALLCALWPLLAVRTVRPSLLLRPRSIPLPSGDHGGRRAHSARPGRAGLWQAGSWKLGGIFVGASAAALLLLVVWPGGGRCRARGGRA